MQNQALGSGINSAQGVIHNLERSIFVNHSRNGNALFLAAREPHSPFANLGIILLGKSEDIIMNSSNECATLSPLSIRIFIGKADILQHRC